MFESQLRHGFDSIRISAIDHFQNKKGSLTFLCKKFFRRTFNEQVLHIIKDEGTFSTMHTLLVYLQTAAPEQCPIVAGLLLQLDILVFILTLFLLCVCFFLHSILIMIVPNIRRSRGRLVYTEKRQSVV